MQLRYQVTHAHCEAGTTIWGRELSVHNARDGHMQYAMLPEELLGHGLGRMDAVFAVVWRWLANPHAVRYTNARVRRQRMSVSHGDDGMQ